MQNVRPNHLINIKKLIFFFIFIPKPIFAYIGPGMAGGVIVATLGIIGAIIFMFGCILYFPIKRTLKKKKLLRLTNSDKDNE